MNNLNKHNDYMSAKKLELKNIQDQIDLGQFHNLTTKR